MQGISKTRHEHLIDALLQMERLLSSDCECIQEAEEYRTELENMYRDYECILSELAKQIRAYELLSARLRYSFWAKS